MKRIMKSYRLSEWELDSIEILKMVLKDKYKVEFNATEIVCKAINELCDKEYKEYLKRKGEL